MKFSDEKRLLTEFGKMKVPTLAINGSRLTIGESGNQTHVDLDPTVPEQLKVNGRKIDVLKYANFYSLYQTVSAQKNSSIYSSIISNAYAIAPVAATAVAVLAAYYTIALPSSMIGGCLISSRNPGESSLAACIRNGWSMTKVAAVYPYVLIRSLLGLAGYPFKLNAFMADTVNAPLVNCGTDGSFQVFEKESDIPQKVDMSYDGKNQKIVFAESGGQLKTINVSEIESYFLSLEKKTPNPDLKVVKRAAAQFTILIRDFGNACKENPNSKFYWDIRSDSGRLIQREVKKNTAVQ